jgi:hypothetical protein
VAGAGRKILGQIGLMSQDVLEIIRHSLYFPITCYFLKLNRRPFEVFDRAQTREETP